MFVDWRNYTPGHQDTNDDRDIGNINDDRDTQRESDRDTRNVRLAITINKASGHKWRPGHREYKWQPGHSKRNYRSGRRNTNDDRDTGNINDDRDTLREIINWDTGIQMTTGTQGNNNNGDARGHRGIYKWRQGLRECSISNHHQQSSRAIIRIMRYRSEYRLFFPWTIICCMFKIRQTWQSIYMHRQWDSQECCTFASFT